MNITTVPFALMRFQYQLARLPLQLLEQRVVARMDSEAPARLFFERSLGMLDVTVGNALGAPELEQRGAALIERSDALRHAAQLDATATKNIKQADADLRATREKATEDREDAIAEKEREVKQAREHAQDRKRTAADNAEKRIVAGKKQADKVAARRKNDAESVKREEQARIRAAEQSATAAANAKLKGAQQKRTEAESKRSQADRVEKLAEAEKQTRQAQRAKDN